MSNLSFGPNQLDTSPKRIDFWQILEGKSAFSEGLIASDIFFVNNFLNLKIAANLFFATCSPLQDFFESEYLSPVKTELDYIEQRVNLISKCKILIEDFDKNSQEFSQLDEVIWLLKFQLYGFGQRLIANDKILYGLIALKEAGVLEKEKVKRKLTTLAGENPHISSLVFEFIGFR